MRVGFLELLTITFIILKLCNVIAWSWLAVLSPLWIPLLLIGLFFIFTLIFVTVIGS